MWLRISEKKLINTKNIESIVVNDVNEDYGDVWVHYNSQSWPVTNILSYDECYKFIDLLQENMLENDDNKFIDLRKK